MNLWYFSKDEDPDARPYEPADARSVQPDHYPNVMRPGGGYPEGKGHKTDAFCNSCDDQLVGGSCLRCDWGPTNRSEPIKNFPIDPVADERAGIRAASWKFISVSAKEKIKNLIEESRKNNNGFATITNKEIAEMLGISVGTAKNVASKLRTKEESKYINALVGTKYDWNKIVTLDDLNLDAIPEKKSDVRNIILELAKSQITLKDFVKEIGRLSGENWLNQDVIAGIIGAHPATIQRFFKDPSIERPLSPKDEKQKEREDNWGKLADEHGLVDALTELIKFNLDPNNVEDISVFDYQNWLNKVDMPNIFANRRSLFRKLVKIISENELIEDADSLSEYTKIKWQQSDPKQLEKRKQLIDLIENKYKWLLPRGKGAYSTDDPGYFYILQSQAASKIGITNDLEQRMSRHERSYADKPELQWELKDSYGPMDGTIPLITEQRMKSWLKKELNIDISIEGIEEGEGWTETAAITAVPPELISFLAKVIIDNDGEVPEKLQDLSDQEIEIILNNPTLFATELGKELGIYQEPVDPNIVREQIARPPTTQQGQIPPNIKPETQAPSSTLPIAKPATDEELAELAMEPGEGAWPDLDSSDLVFDPTTGEQITAEELARRQSKTADYQGWSNWETWNTKLMIDNEYDLYMQSRKIVEERRPIEQFATWATQAVIAPHNQRAIADAQEWNEIPYEERPTGREDMPEEARELVEGIFGDDSREDATAEILDESKVNWNEIYNSIGEDIKESEARAHEGGEHELPMEQYTGYTSEELIEAKADQHPWCPLCNPENPDAPGDLTIPDDWTGF